MKSVTVSSEALCRVLSALVGPPHLIRELQATRGPLVGEGNPINLLIDEFNAQVNAPARSMSRFDHTYKDREDGLAQCKVCRGGEGSLPNCCPERTLTSEEQDAIYAGQLNFARGPMDPIPKWWVPKK